jgi:hypothetical protein
VGREASGTPRRQNADTRADVNPEASSPSPASQPLTCAVNRSWKTVASRE